MNAARVSLLAAVLLVIALPASAGAENRTKRCGGIGETITKLRAQGLDCDSARTLAAKWAETTVGGGNAVARIDGFRCLRRNPPGGGWAVRCARGNGTEVTSFRFRSP